MQSSYLWLVIEQLVFISLLISNMCYIGIRSCSRNKLKLDMTDVRKQLPNVDTVIATTEVVNAFNAQFVPFAVNTYLYLAPTGDKGGLGLQLTMIYISNTLSLIAIIYLIFVPWKKGPEWYLKISPIVFKTMLYLNYTILPIINIGLTIFFTLNPKYDLKVLPLESWVIFVTIICFSRLVEYYSSIKKNVLDDARIYLQAKAIKDEGGVIALPEEESEDKRNIQNVLIEFENDECTNYLNRTRMYGEGDVRIGKSLTLKNDIYCIGFICQIRNDIMEDYLDINKKKLDRADAVRKKALRFHATKIRKKTKKRSDNSSELEEEEEAEEESEVNFEQDYITILEE